MENNLIDKGNNEYISLLNASTFVVIEDLNLLPKSKFYITYFYKKYFFNFI